jgi:outer membrane protein OmpA-like peptidoglycan-associated protein
MFAYGSQAQDIQWAAFVIEYSSELTPIQYSAEQVLGKPTVLPAAGESPTAWTPDRPNKQEFLKVGFDNPMKIRQVVIAESYSPTAISQVYIYDNEENEYPIGSFAPRAIPLKGRLLSIIIEETDFDVVAVKVELDGATVPEYYSLDAIGISASAKPMDVEVEIMENLRTNLQAERLNDNVNSPYKEYKPLLSPTGTTLFFSRKNHPGNMGGVDDDEDIWYSEMDSTGEWKEAVNAGPELNNEEPNFVSGITPDGNTVVLLLGNRYEKKGKMSAGVSISTKEGGAWTKPYNLDIVNDYNYNEKVNYFLTNNRQVLLLSVEREDTNGERDFYVSFFQEDSVWSEPLNMGDVLNSVGDESSPFLAADDETLYFSTNGRGGYGGYDVYVSKRLDDTWTNWSEPQNLGPDINSERDDLFFNIPVTGNYAYYTKSISDDDADIFRVELPLRVMPNEVIVVKGHLRNKETGEPIEAKIIYEKLPEGLTVGITKSHSETGEYEIVLPKGQLYGFRAEAENYLPINENIDLTGDSPPNDELIREMSLVPIAVQATIVLNNIFFDFDRATLKQESYPELERLTKFMQESPKIRIAIAGHTDSTGDPTYNQWLSEWRAMAVANYLMKNGIAESRIEVEFYGAEKPAESNATREGRSKNRRVEFTILEK